MKTFKYSALGNGKKVSGVIEAMDEYVAAERIRAQYPVLLKLTEIQQKESFLNKNLTPLFDAKTLSVICSELGTILGAGVDIATSIQMIAGDMKNKKVKKMLQNTAKDVEEGSSLSAGFEKNCTDIPVTFVEGVRAGEMTGNLEETFEMMTKYYNRNDRIHEKIRQAMIYPIFVIAIAIIVLIIVMVKVMPTILGVFDHFDGNLPALTVFLIRSSKFWANAWGIVLLGVLAVLAGLRIYRHTEKGRPWAAMRDLNRPVTGKIRRMTACADFSITMEMLLRAGIPLTEALDITARGMKNYIFQREIRTFRDQVENGTPLGETMARSKLMPDILTQMVSIGEDTGELEKMLNKSGDYYMNESQNMIQKALAKLEPALLILMAIFAGFIVISVYLPMFTMYDFL